MATIEELQAQVSQFLRRETAAGLAETKPRRFSAFDVDQLDEAMELTARMMELANLQPGDEGLEAVIREAQEASQTRDPDLVRHALMVFIAHHPEGFRLRIPSIEQIDPLSIQPSPPTIGLAAGKPLAYWREDPKLNEHHIHWHVVYPFRGVPNPANPGQLRLRDRQGELFLYMHQQMLARYQAERTSNGLLPEQSLTQFSQPIVDGYDPGPEISTEFLPRPGNQPMPASLTFQTPTGVVVVPRSSLTTSRQAIETATTADRFTDGVDPADPARRGVDILGACIEASSGTLNGAEFGNLHNSGHTFIARIGAGPGETRRGVMNNPTTAMRDPIFYRWHGMIDDLYAEWQDRASPNVFADAPPVRIRKALPGEPAVANESPDILLCFLDQILPGANDATFDDPAKVAQAQQIVATRFGGINWNARIAPGATSTGELTTFMLTRPIPNPFTGQDVTISYLDHRPFAYVLRVENLQNVPRIVTIRIFLAPVAGANNRRTWIEMDKFRHNLQPNEKAVILRRAAESAVIRKPGIKPVQGGDFFPPVTSADTENYCECGWPYNLLVPRGTNQGMAFRLFVIATDWNLDQVPTDSHCGSMSFCGVKSSVYPDQRAMGYPFDRPFAGSVEAAISSVSTIAMRDFTIRHL